MDAKQPPSHTHATTTAPLALTPLLNTVAPAAVPGHLLHAATPLGQNNSPTQRPAPATHTQHSHSSSSPLSAQLAAAWADELVAAKAAATAAARASCEDELATLRARCAHAETALAASDVSARHALSSIDALASQVAALEADAAAVERDLVSQLTSARDELAACHARLASLQAAWRRDVALLETERDAAKAQCEQWKQYAQQTDAEAVALVASAHDMVRAVMLENHGHSGGAASAPAGDAGGQLRTAGVEASPHAML